jgi:hypothetical protein
MAGAIRLSRSPATTVSTPARNRLVVTDDGREELATVEDGLWWCNRRRPGEQGIARSKADSGGRELEPTP